MPDPKLKVVDILEKTSEVTPDKSVVDLDKKATEKKPDNKVSEHPEFDKRIAELSGQIGHVQRQLEVERASGKEKDTAFQTLTNQYQEITSALDDVEKQVSASAAPDYDADPKGYLDWQQQQTLKGVEKIVRPLVTATIPKDTPNTQTPATGPIAPQEAAIAAVHDDYYEIMAKHVNEDMNTDPAFAKAIWADPNPYKAAYKHGIRKKKFAEEFRQNNLSQAYAEGGGTGGGGADDDMFALTAAEKNTVRLMMKNGADIDEGRYLKKKTEIAKRNKGRV